MGASDGHGVCLSQDGDREDPRCDTEAEGRDSSDSRNPNSQLPRLSGLLLTREGSECWAPVEWRWDGTGTGTGTRDVV